MKWVWIRFGAQRSALEEAACLGVLCETSGEERGRRGRGSNHELSEWFFGCYVLPEISEEIQQKKKNEISEGKQRTCFSFFSPCFFFNFKIHLDNTIFLLLHQHYAIFILTTECFSMFQFAPRRFGYLKLSLPSWVNLYLPFFHMHNPFSRKLHIHPEKFGDFSFRYYFSNEIQVIGDPFFF